MVHVPGLTVLLRMSQSYMPIALLISIEVFMDAECSACVLTGIAPISLHSWLQVTGRFCTMQWICLPEKKGLHVLLLVR